MGKIVIVVKHGAVTGEVEINDTAVMRDLAKAIAEKFGVPLELQKIFLAKKVFIGRGKK